MASQSNTVAQNHKVTAASFQNDTQGTIAVIFAFFLVIVLGLVGGAVDFGTAYRQREALYSAADSASLSVVANGSDQFKIAAAMTQDGPVPSAESAAVSNFKSDVAHQVDGVNLLDVRASVIKSGQNVTATVTFRAEVPAHFLGMFGLNTLTVDGHATSVNGTPAFIDFYLLLDNSPSMGIAATTADIDTLVANTPDQCAFACHEADKPAGTDYYGLAKSLGVKTRIDVLREATQALMDTAASTESAPNQFRMSIDTFNRGTDNISALTADLAAAKASAANIDQVVIPWQNNNSDRWTNLDVALADTTAKVPASDTGIDSAHTQKVVFFVTDGVDDAATSLTSSVLGDAVVIGASDPHADPLNDAMGAGQRTLQTVNPTLCDAMKANGIKIAVLYTSYVPVPGWYVGHVSPFADQINPRLKACATPGYFFEVKPNQGIDEAMKTLFLKAVAEAKITS